jgi:hypothetical protein
MGSLKELSMLSPPNTPPRPPPGEGALILIAGGRSVADADCTAWITAGNRR